MTRSFLDSVADHADMIVEGYAFTKDNDNVRVLNLNHPDSAAVLDKKSNIIESSMDDIEQNILLDIWNTKIYQEKL